MVLAGALVALALNVHTYGSSRTSNAGVYVTLPPGHWCGLEYRGTIGGFCVRAGDWCGLLLRGNPGGFCAYVS